MRADYVVFLFLGVLRGAWGSDWDSGFSEVLFVWGSRKVGLGWYCCLCFDCVFVKVGEHVWLLVLRCIWGCGFRGWGGRMLCF